MDDARVVVCSALRFDDGVTIYAPRHSQAIKLLDELTGRRSIGATQGFVDQFCVFMTRQEAWFVAEAAGQIIHRVGGDDADGGCLYSENLY